MLGGGFLPPWKPLSSLEADDPKVILQPAIRCAPVADDSSRPIGPHANGERAIDAVVPCWREPWVHELDALRTIRIERHQWNGAEEPPALAFRDAEVPFSIGRSIGGAVHLVDVDQDPRNWMPGVVVHDAAANGPVFHHRVWDGQVDARRHERQCDE